MYACKLNKWALKPGMIANEEEVCILSVVQVQQSSTVMKEMLSDDTCSAWCSNEKRESKSRVQKGLNSLKY